MDDIDIAIIQALQANARMTASEISAGVRLSVPAVSERIRKLEASGVILRYAAILDPEKLGMVLTAHLFVSLERPKYNERFVESVQSEAEILECHYLAGDFDYLLKVITTGTHALERLLNRIKSVPGVQKTRTIVALSTVKERHSVQPEAPTRNETRKPVPRQNS